MAHFWLPVAVMWLAGALLLPVILPWAVKEQGLTGKWWTLDGFFISLFNGCGRYLPHGVLVALTATVVYPFLIAQVGQRLPGAAARFCNALAIRSCLFVAIVAAGVGRAL